MRSRLPTLLCGLLLGAAATLVVPAGAQAATGAHLARWSTDAQFNTGSRSHVIASGGALRLSGALGATTWDDPYTAGGAVAYQYGQWRSPWVTPGFGVKTLVPSWNAVTPSGTWVRVEIRVRRGSTVGSFDTLGHWASGTSTIHRSSSTTQADDLASVSVDTLRSRDGAFDAWQIQVTLLRKKGSTASPVVASVSGIAAAYATKTLSSTSATTMTTTKVLNVPTYSQMIHRDEFTQYAGGGEAWCSPTTTSMLLRYRGSGPTSGEYAFASHYRDPWVDHAAVNSYDYRYTSTGNWSFTMAYAGRYADAYVTRVGSLRDAEAFIRAGIPLGAAIAFGSGQLTGAPLNSTSGHIVAVVGFTSGGDVVVNDPAASSDSSVRRTYRRGQFERAWLGHSGGIAYVVRP
ncbi:MAG TPA: C39 family peptidase [Aeromicrobium sp.]|nr:C39 family peptidase [Aeromicrobium sp.]